VEGGLEMERKRGTVVDGMGFCTREGRRRRRRS
jgi:hypothetical protein